MAITDIQATVLRVTGVTPTANSVEDAQRYVVSKIPKDLLNFAMTYAPVSDDGSAVAITNDSIVEVTRTGYSCKEIPFSESVWANDTGSLKKATSKFPVYWVQDDGIKIAPATDGSNSGYVYYINYAEVDDDSDLRNAVIFHTSSHEFTKLATDGVPSWSSPTVPVGPSVADFGSDLTISSVSPVSPASPSFTYTDVSVSDIIQSIVSISDMTSMTVSAPSYVEPVLTLGSAPTISDLSIAAVPPDVPSLTAVTFTSISGDIDASLPSTNSYTFTALASANTYTGSAPAYSKPSVTTQVSFNSFFESGSLNPLDDADPGVFSISSVPPVAPIINAESSSTGGAEVDTTKLATAPTYTAPVMAVADFSDADTWVNTEEDPEMVSSRMQVISGQVGEFSAKVQDSLNTFNKENIEYQAKLQIALQDAAQANSGDAALINKFSSDLGTYQANVSKEVQEYQQKLSRYQLEISIVQQTWAKTESDNIAIFQADIQNELNEFNKENVAYQSAIQESIQEVQLTNQKNLAAAEGELRMNMDNESRSQQRELQNGINDMQAIIQNNSSLISKYSAELQQYQSEVAAEVQEYQQNLEGDLQVWQSERQTDIQKYSTDIQNNLNSFNKSNVEYQQDIQRKVQNLQKDIQEALQNAQNELNTRKSNLDKDVQISLQNAIQDFQQDVQEYSAKVQKYSAELNQYQQDVGKEVQDFVNTLNKETQEYQSKLALYNADLQKYQSEITDKTQEGTFKTQNVQYYEKQAEKYYTWAQAEITQYIQNNSKMINQTIAAQAQAQQQQQYRR